MDLYRSQWKPNLLVDGFPFISSQQQISINSFQVSMISKLVPSPDWFVGLDSLNLCENGHFIDSVTVEVPRYDLDMT